MRGPGLFSDIGKKAKDVLGKDYSSDQKLSFATRTDSGVNLTSNAVKKGGLYIGDITSQYKHKNTTLEVKVDTESKITSTVTLEEILPFTKAIATFKLPDYNSGKLEVQYFHDHGSIAGAVALTQTPTVDLSATVGAHGIAFGAEAGFDASSGTFTKYSAGLSLKQSEYIASILLTDKGDTLRASLVKHLDAKQKSAATVEVMRKFSTNETAVTVGSLYEIDPLTSFKTKLNNSGKFGALLQHQIRPSNVLTISGEFDAKALDKKPKFGLALALKP